MTNLPPPPPASSSDPTRGEIGRAILRIESDLAGLRAEMSHLTDKFVTKEVFVEYKTVTEGSIKELQDWKTWALRIVIGAVMLAMLGLVLANAGAGAK